MANNPYVNKVVSDSQTLIDLTSDTVAPADVRAGVTFHDMSGAACVGTASGGSEPMPLRVYVSDSSDDVAQYTMTPVAIVNVDDELVPSRTTLTFSTPDIYSVGVSSIQCSNTWCIAEVINATDGTSSMNLDLNNYDISSGSHGITEVTLVGYWIDAANSIVKCRYNIYLGGEENVVDVPGLIRSIALVSGTTYAVTYGGDNTVGTVNVTLTDGDDGSEEGFKSFTLGIGAATGVTQNQKMQTTFVQDDWGTGLSFKQHDMLYENADTRHYRNSQDANRAGVVTSSKISAVAGAINSKIGTSDYMTLDEMPAKIAGIKSFNWSQCSGVSFHGGKISGTPDLSGIDTSGFTDMSFMFYQCSGLTALDVSDFDTSNVTNMGVMFSSCSGLRTLDVTGFDTAKVTNMNGMFSLCSGLTSIDVTKFDTSKVTDMGSMFQGCSGLTSIDVSEFDTSEVLYMNAMFQGCTGATSIDVSKVDTSKVQNMTNMFYACSSLTSLDLSAFDTPCLTSMGYMFQQCTNLTSINMSNIVTNNVTSSYNIFNRCTNLVDIIWSQKSTLQKLPQNPSYMNITAQMKFYVPDALLNDYKAATNWSTISSQIYPISQLPAAVAALYGIE